MSRWGKPIKNKRFINPRYHLEEKNEEPLEEGVNSWLQDQMASAFLGDEELQRYEAAADTARASEISRARRAKPAQAAKLADLGRKGGVSDRDLSQARKQGPETLGDVYFDTAVDIGAPVKYGLEQAKPYADEALEAAARVFARSTPLWSPAAERITRVLGPALEVPLAYYGATTPDDPTQSWSTNLDPSERRWHDPTTYEGARGWGGSLGGPLGGAIAAWACRGDPRCAVAGGIAGDWIGQGTGVFGRQLGQSLSDYYNRRPEFLGGMTDQQLADAYWDYNQAETGTGAYRRQTAAPHTGRVLQDPSWTPFSSPAQTSDTTGGEMLTPVHEGKSNNMKTLLTESEIKRLKILSNIKTEKPVLSEGGMAALGLMAAWLAGTAAAGYGLSKAQERGKLRNLPDPFGGRKYLEDSANKIRQRVKEQDPLMLDFVKELRANERLLGPRRDKLHAIAQEFKDDPNVAEIVETLAWSASPKALYSALEELQNYIESKLSQPNGENISEMFDYHHSAQVGRGHEETHPDAEFEEIVQDIAQEYDVVAEIENVEGRDLIVVYFEGGAVELYEDPAEMRADLMRKTQT